MAGSTIRILQRREYSNIGLATTASGTVVIQRAVDTSRWREAIVLARLHPTPTWTGTANVALQWALDPFTDEDPAEIWNQTATSLLTFTAGTDTAPIGKIASITAPFGPLVAFILKFTQGTTGSTTFTVSLSVDLNLKGD